MSSAGPPAQHDDPQIDFVVADPGGWVDRPVRQDSPRPLVRAANGDGHKRAPFSDEGGERSGAGPPPPAPHRASPPDRRRRVLMASRSHRSTLLAVVVLALLALPAAAAAQSGGSARAQERYSES